MIAGCLHEFLVTGRGGYPSSVWKCGLVIDPRSNNLRLERSEATVMYIRVCLGVLLTFAFVAGALPQHPGRTICRSSCRND